MPCALRDSCERVGVETARVPPVGPWEDVFDERAQMPAHGAEPHDDIPLGRGQWPQDFVLEEFSGVRNAATHAERVDRRTAGRWRDRLLGVGCVGELVELAKVRVR